MIIVGSITNITMQNQSSGLNLHQNSTNIYLTTEIKILPKRRMENNAKMEYGKAILDEQSCQPECPCCHSKNV